MRLRHFAGTGRFIFTKAWNWPRSCSRRGFSLPFCLDPSGWAVHVLPSPADRRLLMGTAMGVTAVLIIHSPMGKRSGAHFNPAITMTYLRLGKIHAWDAMFYVIFQFCGGISGVGVSALVLGSRITLPAVNYAITVPGEDGTAAAFSAELFMAALLMGVVLWTANVPALAHYTSYLVGILIAFYILLFAPVSGFSINPARTTGSAVFAGVWTAGGCIFPLPCWVCSPQPKSIDWPSASSTSSAPSCTPIRRIPARLSASTQAIVTVEVFNFTGPSTFF